MQTVQNVYSPSKNKTDKFVGAKKTTESQAQENMKALMDSNGMQKSSSLIGRQVEAEAASVDEKIEKLQNLLKMAKGN